MVATAIIFSMLILAIHIINRAPRGFTQVNDGKRFDHIKTCTLTGNFKIFIAAGVDLAAA